MNPVLPFAVLLLACFHSAVANSEFTFTVISINYGTRFLGIPDPATRGMYFNFMISDVDALLGRTDWDNEVFTIINHRFGGAVKVRMWRSANGGSYGADGHGRREPKDHASISDWKKGDKLSFAADGITGNNVATYTHAIGVEAFFYAWGSYCDGEIIDTWTKGLPEGPGSVREFELSKRITTSDKALQGYVGYDRAKSRIVISFRGSANFENWLSNIDIVPGPYPNGNARGISDAKVHPGFYKAFQDLEDEGLYDAIVNISDKYPGADVLCTGHSLGGALTSITALELKLSPKYSGLDIGSVDVITFGCPRVFSPSVAALFNDVIRTSWRIVNRYDLVATVPTKFMGYRHFGTEVWYNYQRWWWDMDPLSFKLCNGSGEDSACFGTDFWPDRVPVVQQHSQYFDLDSGSMCKASRRRLGVSRLMKGVYF